ncbi:unnamed protein product [Chondrus crispus]|uniref:Tc3 transposase DNA binding domain-containing protein n=1 Tax=Chondrus crispus TaxID=2769 RepID=R7QQU9_CHOCR|nr:unnamed protein product [Chondrus crispus]CDF40128.1 unnamed protein product [Chondrus crispus]|eukprot:XP_005710422.1 unnamed protein product [Chondrus crispus]
MGRGKVLNELEKGLIAGLSQGGRTIRDIAAHVQRSKNVVSNLLRAPLEYGRKNHQEDRKSYPPPTREGYFGLLQMKQKALTRFVRSWDSLLPHGQSAARCTTTRTSNSRR